MTVPQIALDARNFYLRTEALIPSCGIAAVLYAESGLKTGPQHNGSTDHGGVLAGDGAYGVASWNGDRQAKLKAFADGKGQDPAALETQLAFVLTECANDFHDVWAAIKAPSTIEDFVSLFVARYENPADHPEEVNRALPLAQALLALPVPQPAPAPSPTPVPPAPSPAPLPIPATDPEIETIGKMWTLLASLQGTQAKLAVLGYLAGRVNRTTQGTST